MKLKAVHIWRIFDAHPILYFDGYSLSEKMPFALLICKGSRLNPLHYSLIVFPLLHIRRFLFSRCQICAKHFKWGYAPMVVGGKQQYWLFSEKGLAHHECYDHRYDIKDDNHDQT